MRVVIYTEGITGVGRLVMAMSAARGLLRAGVEDVTILCAHDFGHLAETISLPVVRLPFEGPGILATERYTESALYRTLQESAPDMIIVSQAWYTVQRMAQDLSCPVVLLLFGMPPPFFWVPMPDGEMTFQPESFYSIFAAEPYLFHFPTKPLAPLILRNSGEILPRGEAAARLGVDPAKPIALIAQNGNPGEFETLKQTYSYLEDEYQVVYSSNYRGGLFPIVDYYNAFDFIVCGAGYSQFWEAIYFEKEALFIPQPRRFESQAWRVENCQDFCFTENGADQLARIITAG